MSDDFQNIEFLLQEDVFDQILPLIGNHQWQTLYLSRGDSYNHLALWCALLDDERANQSLEDTSWDLSMNRSGPGFSQIRDQHKIVTTYHRFTGSKGVRPLLLYRDFDGPHPSYFELDEEFRLYHNLTENSCRTALIDFDPSGREIEVVRFNEKEIVAQLKYLRQFQAATGLHLAIFIDSHRYSQVKLEEVPSARKEKEQKDTLQYWTFSVNECRIKDRFQTCSKLMGKFLIPPPPINEAGKWPYEKNDDREVSFIIATDKKGESVENTSNPAKLSNSFGANEGAPHHLVPIFFRRDVLVKYYAEPERYAVCDGSIRCIGSWSCRIDNDHEKYVIVCLGDLGDLPYEERLYWRTYNVPPDGVISETNFLRNHRAWFADAKSSDLAFRREYVQLNKNWHEKFGWFLFLELAEGDAHLIETVRIPLNNSQPEMDQQVIFITKLLIDSLNEVEIKKHVGDIPKDTRGITKFKLFFEKTNFPQAAETIQFLRNLQDLRSTGSGHRKGADYESAIKRLKIDLSYKAEAVKLLLNNGLRMFHFLREFYMS